MPYLHVIDLFYYKGDMHKSNTIMKWCIRSLINLEYICHNKLVQSITEYTYLSNFKWKRYVILQLYFLTFHVFVSNPVSLYHVSFIWNALTHEGKIIDIREYSCWRALYSCKVYKSWRSKRGNVAQYGDVFHVIEM